MILIATFLPNTQWTPSLTNPEANVFAISCFLNSTNTFSSTIVFGRNWNLNSVSDGATRRVVSRRCFETSYHCERSSPARVVQSFLVGQSRERKSEKLLSRVAASRAPCAKSGSLYSAWISAIVLLCPFCLFFLARRIFWEAKKTNGSMLAAKTVCSVSRIYFVRFSSRWARLSLDPRCIARAKGNSYRWRCVAIESTALLKLRASL